MPVVSATVVADSISPQGVRLTTMQVKFHRFVLAEFNTHRVFSRNFRSSRAVPVKRLLEEVRTDPAMPVWWGKNQTGMQAPEELSDEYDQDEQGRPKSLAMQQWRRAAVSASDHAEALADTGLHKQIANRVLEPFLFVHGVVTSTEWDNFFGLRLHKDAQPEMRVLAEAMWDARQKSCPTPLKPGEWHLPFIDSVDEAGAGWAAINNGFMGTAAEMFTKVSVARCARVSYNSFDSGKRSTVEEDLKLYDRLLGAQPFHASPAEHQATPDTEEVDYYRSQFCDFANDWEHGNFRGWRQYRKMLEGEAVAPLPKGYAT